MEQKLVLLIFGSIVCHVIASVILFHGRSV